PEAFFFQSKAVTVIGLNHEKKLRQVGGEVQIISKGLTSILTESFLHSLSAIQKDLQKERSFPFEHGGIFGCLGYEIVGEMEPRLMKSGYFKNLGESEEVLAEVVLSHNLIVIDHEKNSLHFALRD